MSTTLAHADPPGATASRVDLSDVRGSVVPRIYTLPLVPQGPTPCPCGVCGLDESNSDGGEFIDFNATDLASPLDPWQEFAAWHGLERLEDGRPRFRHLLLLVARQNGKTEIPVRLSLWWQFKRKIPMTLGTSTKLDYAKMSLERAIVLGEGAPGLPVTIADRRTWYRQANGEQESRWDGCRYKIAPANEEGGRSLTVHRLILDELRQHKTYAAWGAAVPAGNAVRDFQLWALSNAGTADSVVLNDKRAAALGFIETGEGDYRLGLFEWSAPEGSDPLDIAALAQANPNLGYRLDPEALLGDARTAVAAGGEALATFKIESMCMNVPVLRSAIPIEAWAKCAEPGDLDWPRRHGKGIALCFDVSPDGLHATLVAAGVLVDGRTRVEVQAQWEGPTARDQLQRDLPGWVERIRPRAVGWFPNGPAAALASSMKMTKSHGGEPRTRWELIGASTEEIRSEVSAVCMGLESFVQARSVVHNGDELLTSHVTGSDRQKTGDTWRFSRKGGHCDGAYASAGAVHLAQTLGPKPGRQRIIRPASRAI